MALAALTIAATAAACFPGAPPTTPAQLTLSPSPVDFGSAPLAGLVAHMPILTVTVTNTGGQPLHSLTATAGGQFGALYTVMSPPSNACSGLASLGPGQSCGIDLQFCPTAVGPAPANLTVTGMSDGGPVSALVFVTGTAT